MYRVISVQVHLKNKVHEFHGGLNVIPLLKIPLINGVVCVACVFVWCCMCVEIYNGTQQISTHNLMQ